MHEQTLIEDHLHKLLLLQAQLMRFQVAPMYVLVQKVSGPVEIIHMIALILKGKESELRYLMKKNNGGLSYSMQELYVIHLDEQYF